MMAGLGFRLFRVMGLRDLGFRDLGFRDLGFRDLGFRVWVGLCMVLTGQANQNRGLQHTIFY